MSKNIYKMLKLKFKKAEDNSWDLENMPLSRRSASVCRSGGDKQIHEREKRGKSVPIILSLRNNNPAISASPVPEQSSDIASQGSKVGTRIPMVRIPKLKLNPAVIKQLRTEARKVPPP